MTLTIFKNDDFENVGIEVTETYFEDGKRENRTMFRFGITSGWQKEVPMTHSNWNNIEILMLKQRELAVYEQFQFDFFDVIRENDAMGEREGWKMKCIEEKKITIKGYLANALARIK